jgi:hypothetical protein
MRHDELTLDARIRDWVLLPILLGIVLLAYFRKYLTKLLSAPSSRPDLKAIREGQVLTSAGRFRVNCTRLPLQSFRSRRQYWTKEGLVLPPKENPLNAMMSNPGGLTGSMMDGLKRNLPNVLTQPLVMVWVGFFFSGFVVVKIPFPLTLQFRSMLQRGVEQLDLDVSYVSSLSWYMIALFGLMGVNTLLMGGGSEMEMMLDPATQAIMSQMSSGAAADPHTAFAAEKSNIEIHKHEWIGRDVEQRLMASEHQIAL